MSNEDRRARGLHLEAMAPSMLVTIMPHRASRTFAGHDIGLGLAPEVPDGTHRDCGSERPQQP